MLSMQYKFMQSVRANAKLSWKCKQTLKYCNLSIMSRLVLLFHSLYIPQHLVLNTINDSGLFKGFKNTNFVQIGLDLNNKYQIMAYELRISGPTFEISWSAPDDLYWMPLEILKSPG